MNRSFSILIVLVFTIVSCVYNKETSEQESSEYYLENHLSFFDPHEVVYYEGKNQGYTYQTWIRQPENLRMLHETFKKIGYDKLVSEYDLTSDPCLLWSYINRPLNQIIDSLVITHSFDTITSKYYREFWLRRKKEKNDQIVFEILEELSDIFLKNKPVNHNDALVNDTLYNLILIDRVNTKPTDQQALKNFEYLKQIGMYGSAYNLLFERYEYQEINWDKDKLESQLETDNQKCCPRTWIKDNTK